LTLSAVQGQEDRCSPAFLFTSLLVSGRFSEPQPNRHHPLVIIPVRILKTELPVKLNGNKVCYVYCQPDRVETELFESLECEPRQFRSNSQIPVVLIDKDHKFTRLPLHIGNQRSVAYDVIAPPCKKILPNFEKLLHPAMTGLRVFGREALGGRLRRERSVHLTKKRKVLNATDAYLKDFPRFVGSGNTRRLHRGTAPRQYPISSGKKNILQSFGKGNLGTVLNSEGNSTGVLCGETIPEPDHPVRSQRSVDSISPTIRQCKAVFVRGSLGNFSGWPYPQEKCPQISLQSDNPKPSPSSDEHPSKPPEPLFQ